MVKQKLYILLLICFSFYDYSQHSKIDSLNNLIGSAKHDTTWIILLEKKADLLDLDSISSVISIYQNVITQSKKLGYKNGEARGYLNLGRWYGNISKNDSFFHYLDMGYKLADQLGNKIYKARVTRSFGNYYYNHQKFSKAINEYNKGLAEIGNADTLLIIHFHNGIGATYYIMGMLDKANISFIEANKLASLVHNDKMELMTLTNIANIYTDIGQSPEAISTLKKIVSKNIAIKNYRGLVDAMNALGFAYYTQKQFSQALFQFSESQKILEEHKKEIGDFYYITNYEELLLYYGNTYYEMDSLNNSLKSFTEYLEIHKKSNSKESAEYNEVLMNIGRIYMKMNRDEIAIKWLNEAYDLAAKQNNPVALSRTSEQLYEYYKKKKNASSALNFLEIYNHNNTIVEKNKNSEKVTQLKFENEISRNEMQISLLHEQKEKKDTEHAAEVKQQKMIIWTVAGGFLFMLLLAGFIYRGYRQKQKANEEITEQKALVDEKQKEILDSIKYAQRIQKALITSEKYFEKHLNKKS